MSHTLNKKGHHQDSFLPYGKKKKKNKKYDHSCKIDQLFPADILQSSLLLADSAK